MFKNLTIRQVSLLIAVSLCIIHCLLLYLFTGEILRETSGQRLFILSILLLLLTYGAVNLLIRSFVFRKIKLIYKVISNSKDSLKTAQTINNDTSLDLIKDEVTEWANKKEEQITLLKTLETYRRQYLGDVSHELKTPLFSIQGYLHTLLEGGMYDENINTKYLKRAIENVGRLQNIVEDLEMINTIDLEVDQLKITQFDIKVLTEEVFADMEVIAKEKELALSFKPGADKSFQVKADRNKIRQVLINLINNSIKYGNLQGYTKISFYDMDKLILIEVSDNGIGISEKDAKHVFDRFYRVDKSRSRTEGGSGLGLAIVKHIMDAHGQKVVLRSTPGKGSTFGFTLNKN